MTEEYIVISRQDSVAKNGSPFVNLKLANNEENITMCVFDVRKESGPQIGQLVAFTQIHENAGRKSANNLEMKVGQKAPEGHPLYNLLPRPVKRELWDQCIDHLIEYCTDERAINFIRKHADSLFGMYAKWPAATSMHHAFPGGLLNHTYQMLHMLEGLYPVYPYTDDIRVERIIIGVLFHDWGKLLEYTAEGETREQMYLLGHIYMSANYLNNLLRDAEFDKRETNLIVHCVLAHHGQMEYGSPVLPCLPEATIITYLDNLSAKADVYNSTGHMEKSYALGTNVIK